MRNAFSNFSQPHFWPYFIFGGSSVLRGIILFPISIVKRGQEFRQERRKH